MNNQLTTKESILKEFREKFLMKGSECTWETYPNPEEVESFLSSKIDEIERETREKAHEPFYYKDDKFVCCRKCGLIMPRKGWGIPCPGVVKIELRDNSLSHPKDSPVEGEEKGCGCMCHDISHSLECIHNMHSSSHSKEGGKE